MFGGILEVTKESEEIYVFHIPSSTWKLINMNEGPISLASYFKNPPQNKGGKRDELEFMIAETRSNPDLEGEKAGMRAEKFNMTINTANIHGEDDKGISQGNFTVRDEKRSKSMGRPGVGSSWTTRRTRNRGVSRETSRFGIIPTFESNLLLNRGAYVRKMKKLREKDEDTKRFLENQNRLVESPTSMKMKNTFLLLNNNPSFDSYAAQMKKRKNQANNVTGMTTHSQLGNSTSKLLGGEATSTVNINKKNPAARDGHVSVLLEGKMFVFGGDRHHMPFNDLFMLDLEDFFND